MNCHAPPIRETGVPEAIKADAPTSFGASNRAYIVTISQTWLMGLISGQFGIIGFSGEK